MRLAKYLAHAGVASRRAAEALIAAGRVRVGGELVRDPARDVDDGDAIWVDGRRVDRAEPREVHLVHKPLGVVSTARDPGGRPTVVALVPSRRRLYPVGRLDADTTGLILLTNDGGLAHALTHPRYEVPRTYRLTVRPPIGDAAIAALRRGVALDDGPTAPTRVRRLASDRIELVLREGRKRQVRRMAEAVGHRVVRLERVAFGSLRLDGLAPGAHRQLAGAELRALREAASGAGAGSRAGTGAGWEGADRDRPGGERPATRARDTAGRRAGAKRGGAGARSRGRG